MGKTGIIYKAHNLVSGKSYIGQTICKLGVRISNHYKDSNRYTFAFANALKKYKKEDWRWSILYKNVPVTYMCVAEICAIYTYDTYYNGYNSTLGGDESPSLLPEVAQKISKALRGRKQPKELVEKRVSQLRGKKHTEETKRKISAAHKGKKMSEESKKKMSESHRGVKLSNDHRNSISLAGKGRVFTEEHKEKISKANKGKKRSDKTRKKLSESRTGKKLSEETKRKLSESHIGKKHTEEAKRKVALARAKTYKIIKPDGTSEIIHNLSKYCRENNLSNSKMNAVSNGKRKHYKGYKCKKIED